MLVSIKTKWVNPLSANLTKWPSKINNSSAIADESFECVWPFFGAGALRFKIYFQFYHRLKNVIRLILSIRRLNSPVVWLEIILNSKFKYFSKENYILKTYRYGKTEYCKTCIDVTYMDTLKTLNFLKPQTQMLTAEFSKCVEYKKKLFSYCQYINWSLSLDCSSFFSACCFITNEASLSELILELN